MDVQRLRAVQQHILEEPRRVDMGEWHITKEGDPKRFAEVILPPKCNTVACIAGWTVDLFGDLEQGMISSQAANLLDLTTHGADQLFQPMFWAFEFRERLFKHKIGTQGYAQAVSDYIDFFIKEQVGFEKEML